MLLHLGQWDLSYKSKSCLVGPGNESRGLSGTAFLDQYERDIDARILEVWL